MKNNLQRKYRLSNTFKAKTLHFLKVRQVGISLLLSSMSACAIYEPLPLEAPTLASSIQDLAMPSNLNLSDGLHIQEVGVIAVLNNPQLKSVRLQMGISEAQVYSTGLFPDPQFGFSLDKPKEPAPGLVNSQAFGFSYDLIPLVTRSARNEAAVQSNRQSQLEVQWQEWQVIQQARILSVRRSFEKVQLDLLNKMATLYQQRYDQSAKALARGDTTLDVNGTDLTSLLDTLSLINDLEQTRDQTNRDLNLLLGLSAEAEVPLIQLPPFIPFSNIEVQQLLDNLPARRPDLLGLKAGYEAQEANVRSAVLAQFPSLGVGISHAHDTAGLITNGISINLNLPIFSGNRGNIAIARATRAQLREEYSSRLAQVQADVVYLLETQNQLLLQLNNLEHYLPQLRRLLDHTEKAYSAGEIDAIVYLNMESTWLNKRLEQIQLLEASWESYIALSAMLAQPGWPHQTTISEFDTGSPQ